MKIRAGKSDPLTGMNGITAIEDCVVKTCDTFKANCALPHGLRHLHSRQQVATVQRSASTSDRAYLRSPFFLFKKIEALGSRYSDFPTVSTTDKSYVHSRYQQ